jgi:YD repeat-containing protein
MKKLLILIAAILSLAHHGSGQVPKRYEVFGPVKSFLQETAKLTEVDGKTVEGPRVLVQTATFDKHEKVTERAVYNPDGTVKWKDNWFGESTYDTNGREAERVSRDAAGEVTSRTVFRYDSNGNQTKSITYGAGGEITFYDTFEYDKNGHKILANYFNTDGSTRNKDVFAYDARGFLIEITHSAGTLQHRDSYKYDDRGNQIEWSFYDKDGKRGLKVSFGYSDDSRGIPTEFLQYDSNDKVVSKEVYTYEFDARGNWIRSKTRREVFGGPAPVVETEMTYRTITYWQPQQHFQLSAPLSPFSASLRWCLFTGKFTAETQRMPRERRDKYALD